MAIEVEYDHGEGIYTVQSLKNRNFGIITGTITFDDSYPAGGEDASEISGKFRECLGMVFMPYGYYELGYIYQNDKIAVGHNTPTLGSSSFAAAGQTHTVTDDDTPGGNEVYVKFGPNGPYLACNCANDTADVLLNFGDGIYVVIKHDAGAAAGNGSAKLTFDDDGTHPDRLVADLTGGVDNDVFIATTDPRYFLKIVNSDGGEGVDLYYDDGANDRLECTTAGDADAAIDLCVVANELPDGTDASGLEDVPFFAYGWI